MFFETTAVDQISILSCTPTQKNLSLGKFKITFELDNAIIILNIEYEKIFEFNDFNLSEEHSVHFQEQFKLTHRYISQQKKLIDIKGTVS